MNEYAYTLRAILSIPRNFWMKITKYFTDKYYFSLKYKYTNIYIASPQYTELMFPERSI